MDTRLKAITFIKTKNVSTQQLMICRADKYRARTTQYTDPCNAQLQVK